MNRSGFLITIMFLSVNIIYSNKIGVVGAGYVGLVTSAVLADFGHEVICADIDNSKIEKLYNYELPIYEPGLADIIFKNLNKNLNFTTDLTNCIRSSEIIFIAVGTPMSDNGNADLRALYSVINSISKNLNNSKVICIKSTVPISTTKSVEKLLQDKGNNKFDIIFNPEFLREGSALNDFYEKNPIVLGSNSKKAIDTFTKIYQPLLDKGLKLIVTDPTSAETIKYAWNSFSAIKLAYVNELDSLCQKTDANIFDVIKGMSFSDKLMPVKNIIPGPGYGGSCLPKDTRAFSAISNEYFNFNLNMVKAAIKSNKLRKQEIINKVLDCVQALPGNNSDKVVSILGLSFKANTDDTRNSIAIDLIQNLLEHQVQVKVYDPASMKNIKQLFPDIIFSNNINQALKDSCGIVLLTEWSSIKKYDIESFSKNNSKIKFIIDPRYIWKGRL